MRRIKGMSLIELIVVTALVMILAGGGGVALNTFNEKQKVVAARDELVASLRLARNAARTAKGPADREIKYVAVSVVPGGGVRAVDDTGAVTYVDKDISGAGVEIAQSPSGDILFSPYETKLARLEAGGAVVPLSWGSFYQMTISSGMGTTAVVVIDASGLINGQ